MLTDQNKLAIIEGLKKEAERVYTGDGKGEKPASPHTKIIMCPKHNGFSDSDVAWLKETFDHFGVKYDISLCQICDDWEKEKLKVWTNVPCPDCGGKTHAQVYGSPLNNGGEMQYFQCDKCNRDYSEESLFG